jgi:uncharacterized delta-60 repeat protein
MAAMLLLLLLLAVQVRAQSALDGFKPLVNIWVYVVVVQPDGKILIGGLFTSIGGVARNHIARLNPDGTLDIAFDPNINGHVLSLAVQADGKILAGGVFNNVGGQTRNNIARLDATTGLPDSFNPNANGGVEAIVVQADGKILAGGNFTAVNGQTRSHISRLDPASGLPDSFDPSPNAIVYSLAVQADGKILAGGDFTGIGGQPRNRIARVDAATGLADSFNPNANHIVRAIALQVDGKVLAGGQFSGPNAIGGQARSGIARLDAMTGLADSFNPNVNNWVQSIGVQADGKVLAGGFFNNVGGQTRNYIARLDATTGLPDSFDPNPDAAVHSVAVQADGKVLMGGRFIAIGGQQRLNIARLETDGSLDRTLDLGMAGMVVVSTAVQPDGKILLGGLFTSVLGVTRNNIARLNPDGTLDAAFNPNADSAVESILVQADGKILVSGFFTSIGGQQRNRIARLDATTGLADSFDPNANDGVYSLALQADGKILAGGFFTSMGGETRNHIARIDAATGLIDSFDPNANSVIRSIAVQADGKILAGGNFQGANSIGGQTRNFIARLDATTGLADSFDPNANGTLYSIAVQTDGRILAGGTFSSIGGQTRNLIARLDPTTALADSFNPNAMGGAPMGHVKSIAVQADGRVLVGGTFENIGGLNRAHIARLDGSTGLADSFDPSADGVVWSIAVQPDGKILAGGAFNAMGGLLRNLFARLSNDTAALQHLAVARTTVTWTRGGSSPQLDRITFEVSNDNANYALLGNGTAAGSNWTLTGLSLPVEQNIYIRARGYYRSAYQASSESITELVRTAFILRPTTLGNISTRLRALSGDNAMIGGFIITGTQTKTVVVRGIGPSLPILGALADPVIEVYGSSGQLLATNDNWNDSLTRQQIIDSGLAPANDLESALWGVIDPGAYTVVVRGRNNATGIGLFEVYDVDPEADSKLANVSTRGFVANGDDVMIGGAILRGAAAARVLLRAIGPSLTNFGVPNALSDPTLELRDGNGGLIAANDNWRTDQEAQIIATGIPPSNNLESAIVRDLVPGNYTAIVRGSNNTTGVALIEAFELD